MLSRSGEAPKARHVSANRLLLKRSNETPAIRKLAATVTALLSATALSSCAAIYDPYVSMTKTLPTAPSFDQAVAEARLKASDFDEKLGQLEKYNFGTGALLFGSSIVGLGFALFGAHTDAIVGAGLAGGTAAGSRSFLPIEQRKLAYASGSAAIDCAITAFSLNAGVPVPGAGSIVPIGGSSSRSQAGSGPLIQALDALEAIDLTTPVVVRSTTTGGSTNTTNAEFASAITALDDASQTAAVQRVGVAAAVSKDSMEDLERSVQELERGQRTLLGTMDAALNTRGQGLVAATAAIVHSVNAQIIEARLDPNAALSEVRSNSLSLTESAREHAKKLRDQGNEAADDGQDAAADSKKAAVLGQANRDSNAENAGEEAEAVAMEQTKKANDVARLAQQILEMVKTSSACAFGPTEPDND